MRYSGIGGQAVIEGVMMRNADQYAVAVRKPDGVIEVKVSSHKSLKDKYAFFGVPVIRGVVAFVESLMMGIRTLNYSASFWEEEEEQQEGQKKRKEQKEQAGRKAETEKSGKRENKTGERENKTDELWMGLIVMLAVILAVGLFVLLPFFVSELLSKAVRSVHLRGLIEGVIRVALFVGYVKAISRMEDIRRVFMYHGAEHKCINCIENGHALTVENAKRQTMVHKRCGTSFMLVVMFVSILFFMFISVPNIWLRMVLRILLIPVIAGISYEFIIFAGKSESPVVAVLSRPGLWLQSLTTREPDEDMLKVAISSVEAVFDWEKFLKEGKASAVKTTPVAEVAASTERQQSGETEVTSSDGFEVLEVNGEEDDDEILQALDRYFEDPADAGSDGERREDD